MVDAARLGRVLATDGPLGAEHFNVETARAIDAQVWGRGRGAGVGRRGRGGRATPGRREAPEASLRHAGAVREAIWFGRSEPLPDRVRPAYRLSVDEYNGRERVQMVVEAAG